MRVENAADYPEFIDTVAKWQWQEWGHGDLQDLTPWIAGMFVITSERGKGVGTMLMRHAATEAGRIGVRKLFLYTSTARRFYERLGCALLREDSYEGGPVRIMALGLG